MVSLRKRLAALRGSKGAVPISESEDPPPSEVSPPRTHNSDPPHTTHETLVETKPPEASSRIYPPPPEPAQPPPPPTPLEPLPPSPPAENGTKEGISPEQPLQESEQDDAIEPPDVLVHAQTLLSLAGVTVLIFSMLLIKLFRPSAWELWWFTLYGFMFGLGLYYRYRYNRQKKMEAGCVLRLEPGVKGTTLLFGEPPTWLSYRNMDRVEWLNKALSEMWPFYDRAVCDAIKDILEPIMEDVRPQIFKHIGFKKLTFGDVPFRIEGVSVDTFNGELQMDIDIRWCGDSNITLSIEPNLPGDVTRIAPTISRISLVGTLRLSFKPLLSKTPCIGAIVVSLLRPPLLNFEIDVGKALGGGAIGATVKKALGPFIKDTLVNMLVWPRRYVVPIMYEADTGPLDHLELHSVGLLKIKIVEAKDLPAADMGGTSDPIVEVFTEVSRKFKTKVVKANLNPKWQDEVKYLLVQEPRTQYLRINVYDIDIINARSLIKGINLLKNIKDMVGAEELLGRAQILIQTLISSTEEVDDWYELGMGDWAAVHGPGSGCGEVRLKITYTPFSSLNPTNSTVGAVVIKIYRCRNLFPMDSSGTSDPYIRMKLVNETFQTHVVRQNLNPEFHLTYEWWNVPVGETLKIKVFDKDFGPQSDDFMGRLDFPISKIVTSVGHNGRVGLWKDWFKLNNIEHGDIELMLEFVPFD